MTDINETMRRLAQYSRLAEETAQIIEELKTEIKDYMTEHDIETLNGDEHRAIYKLIGSDRLDTAALKKSFPEIAERFTKKSFSWRFTFA